MKENSIEDILSENEKILQRIKPKKSTLILEAFLKGLPFVLIWLLADLAIVLGIIYSEEANEILPFIFIFIAVHLLPVWMYLANIVRTVLGSKNIEYVFTDKRIIIRSGVIGIDFKSILYTDISGINCKVGIIERICKVGDLYIKATNQSAVLNNIPRPYFFLNQLQKITLDIKADILYPNNLRPKDNDGYNSNYKG